VFDIDCNLHWRVLLVQNCIGEAGDSKSIHDELIRSILTLPGECVNSRLYRRMEDPRSIPDELVKDL
jgi:hypothetical protein